MFRVCRVLASYPVECTGASSKTPKMSQRRTYGDNCPAVITALCSPQSFKVHADEIIAGPRLGLHSSNAANAAICDLVTTIMQLILRYKITDCSVCRVTHECSPSLGPGMISAAVSLPTSVADYSLHNYIRRKAKCCDYCEGVVAVRSTLWLLWSLCWLGKYTQQDMRPELCWSLNSILKTDFVIGHICVRKKSAHLRVRQVSLALMKGRLWMTLITMEWWSPKGWRDCRLQPALKSEAKTWVRALLLLRLNIQ